MESVIVIGGGPAGMIAAITAARNNKKVVLIEKNAKLGKKLFITGKGRCNLTNASDVESSLGCVLSNKKFLYSAFYELDSTALMAFFEELGVQLKVERGNRVFPLSDKSSDINRALERELQHCHVEILLNSQVRKVLLENNIVKGVQLKDKRVFEGSSVIVATGGLSYAMTGSTGDGYQFALDSGHQVISTAPGLVPLETQESWVTDLQGLSLKNISIRITQENRGKNNVIFEEFGEMLFTHFGLSGPLILSGSSYLPKDKVEGIKIIIDLKPSLTIEQLDQRIMRDFEKNNRKHFCNALNDLLPQKIIPTIVSLSQIDPEKIVALISREERMKVVQIMKNLTCTIQKTRDYNESIITRGGVDVKEIHKSTMESKRVSGLFFVGEVLDLDALTGGYNLQIAFSTGYLAGKSAK